VCAYQMLCAKPPRQCSGSMEVSKDGMTSGYGVAILPALRLWEFDSRLAGYEHQWASQ
jgi:hypothetical protein